jgi:hypothetical protein
MAAKERADSEKVCFWWRGARKMYRQLLLNRVVVRAYIKRMVGFY